MSQTPKDKNAFPWWMMIGLAVPVIIGLVMFVLFAIGVLKMR